MLVPGIAFCVCVLCLGESGQLLELEVLFRLEAALQY